MHKLFFKAAAAAALLSSTTLVAATPKGPCMTRDEAHGLIGYFAPSLIETAVARCKPHLAADAYLLSQAPNLVAPLREKQAAAWPLARAAFSKISRSKADKSDPFDSLSEDVVRPLMEAMIVKELGNEIKPQNCPDIERIAATMAPMPAGNIVDLLTEIVVVAGRGDRKLNTCGT